MKSARSILSLKYTPATSVAAVRKAVGGFLRYVQYRDHHEQVVEPTDVDGLLRYVAWRDVATPQGRLFNRAGVASDPDRKALGDLIARSIAGQPERQSDAGAPRACYRMVLSPEDARGLDLREVTRATLRQLENDCGGALPSWIAAEHRNTRHPHTHVVMAARAEIEPGKFRSVVITRRRLARMKQAMLHEISRQRGERTADLDSQLRILDRQRARSDQGHQPHMTPTRLRWRAVTLDRSIGRFAGRVARRYIREAEMVARERELLLIRERSR